MKVELGVYKGVVCMWAYLVYVGVICRYMCLLGSTICIKGEHTHGNHNGYSETADFNGLWWRLNEGDDE